MNYKKSIYRKVNKVFFNLIIWFFSNLTPNSKKNMTDKILEKTDLLYTIKISRQSISLHFK